MCVLGVTVIRYCTPMSMTLCLEEPQVTEGYRVFGDMHVGTTS